MKYVQRVFFGFVVVGMLVTQMPAVSAQEELTPIEDDTVGEVVELEGEVLSFSSAEVSQGRSKGKQSRNEADTKK